MRPEADVTQAPRPILERHYIDERGPRRVRTIEIRQATQFVLVDRAPCRCPNGKRWCMS